MEAGHPPSPPGAETIDWGRSGAPRPPRDSPRVALVAAVAFTVGAVLGALTLAWWGSRDDATPATPSAPSTVSDAVVRLVLSKAPAVEGGGVLIEAALLHDRESGPITVTGIERTGASIVVDAPELPVDMSVNHSYERIDLRIRPQNCNLADEWTPSSQPFVVTWEDESGTEYEALGGDHDGDLEIAVIGFLSQVCGRTG